LIVLASYPGPDVRRTVAKHNTPARLVLSQEANGVTIGEDQISKIQDKDASGRLGVDQLAQFVHIGRVKLTADREHNRSTARAMNPQHRPRRSERNWQATRKAPERTGEPKVNDPLTVVQIFTIGGMSSTRPQGNSLDRASYAGLRIAIHLCRQDSC
jgi:hypothetical protein